VRRMPDATFLFMVILAFAIWLVIALVLRAAPVAAQSDFVHDVAARCKGEASWAVPECACTVRNRLNAGFTEANVLTAYYAQDVEPSDFDLWATAFVLARGCREDLYFMFSNHDAVVLGLEYVLPVLMVQEAGDGRLTARFYAKDVFEERD
jgi:Na+-transporting methylmalonyl-CoA/oxaloacetate decarboxylase gamma subunit